MLHPLHTKHFGALNALTQHDGFPEVATLIRVALKNRIFNKGTLTRLKDFYDPDSSVYTKEEEDGEESKEKQGRNDQTEDGANR